MVVLPSQNVDVQRHARGNRERVEDMREHLRREVPDLFAFDAEVGDAEGA